jgi:hypothetical protein
MRPIRLKLGPFSIHLSKRGLSAGGKVGPMSTNSRTRKLRVRLRTRKRMAPTQLSRYQEITWNNGIWRKPITSELAPSETG